MNVMLLVSSIKTLANNVRCTVHPWLPNACSVTSYE